MRDLIRAICLVLILSLSAAVSHARTEHPMFLNFEPAAYRSANQNWNIAQGADGFIYVANHKCLMRFNGITWDRFYPFGESNPEVIRSISADAKTGRIYVGSYDKFGYYSPADEFGELKFTLLSDKVEGPLGNNLWSICPVGDKVLFLFFSAWYLYDPATDGISKGRVTWKRSFVWNGDLYVSDDTHVKRWDKDKESFVPAFDRDFPSTVLAIWGRNEDEAAAITEASGIIAAGRRDNPSPSYEELQGGWPTVNRALCTSKGDIIAGTIEKGLYAFAPDGSLLWHLDSSVGLIDDTVLALFEDNRGNIWAAMDKGVVCVLSDSHSFIPVPTSEYGKKTTLDFKDNRIYLGTNRGLFDVSVKDHIVHVESLGLKKQVWSISDFEDLLFVGGNSATYILQNGKLDRTTTKGGGTGIRPVMKNNRLFLVQGSNKNLLVYERASDGQWTFKNLISGLTQPVKRIEVDQNNNIWLENKYYGTVRVTLGEDLDSIESSLNYNTPGHDGPTRTHLAKIEGEIVLYDSGGFYRYDPNSDALVPDLSLDGIFTPQTTIENVLPCGNHEYCFFGDGKAYVLDCSDPEPRITEIIDFDAFDLTLPEYWNTVKVIGDGQWLFPVEEGLFIYSRNKGQKSASAGQSVRILKIKDLNSGQEYPVSRREINLPYRASISLELGVENHIGGCPAIQCRMSRYDKEELLYDSYHGLDFHNLKSGKHTLEISLLDPFGKPAESLTVQFRVSRPWWSSGWMIALYVILLGALAYGAYGIVHILMSRQKARLEEKNRKALEEEELKHERDLISVKNEQLEKQVFIKSKELAAYSLIEAKRNDVLEKIGRMLAEIRATKPEALSKEDYDLLDSVIKEGRFSQDEWDKFYENFDLIHDSFFRTLNARYGNLSTNDLRMCAYLRLNMSSKEIATAMGISPKSVDQAKYRLRKKLNLEQRASLEQFLLNIEG